MKTFRQFVMERAEYAVVKYKDKDGTYRTPSKLKSKRPIIHDIDTEIYRQQKKK